MSVRFEMADHIARVTIDRPEVLNALDDDHKLELGEIWKRCQADREIRCVMLTGAGDRAFCAGTDVKALDPEGPDSLAYWASAPPGGHGGIALQAMLDVPVIARVNGLALGGGFEIVLGCDIVIAADHAEFGLPEPRIGLLPLDGGAVMLPRRIPIVHAMGMMLTGRRIKAEEALGYGLVNAVVPGRALDETVDRWMADILACAPLSLRAMKQMVRRTVTLSLVDAHSLRLPALVEWARSEDAREGPRAFREKRAPEWKGR